MIKAIQQLASTCASVNILAMATADGRLSLTFIPKAKEGGDASLSVPFTLSGTAEELEAGIGQALQKVNANRATLAEQVEATNTLLAQASKDSAEKGTNALKAKGSKPAPGSKNPSPKPSSPATGNDDDVDDEDDTPGGADMGSDALQSAAIADKASQAPSGGALNLFG